MTRSTILVGIDFSEHSELARRHAVAVARRLGREITLCHAISVPDHASARDWIGIAFDRAQRELEELRVRTEREGVRAHKAFVNQHPDVAVAAAARELDCELVVVGTHGRTGVARFFLGSVAERTVRAARCDALVARGPTPDRGYRRVLVPTDFSAAADAALARAIELVADDGVVELYHAWGVEATDLIPVAELTAATQMLQDIDDNAVELGQQRVARYESDRVRVRYLHEQTSPVRGIEQRMAELRPDLIAMGTHGRRGFRRWVLGSVAESTVRHAPCSVVVSHAGVSGAPETR